MNWIILQECQRNCINFPGCHNKAAQTDNLAKTHFLTILESRSPKLKRWWGWVFVGFPRKGLSHAFLSFQLLTTLEIRWFAAVHMSSTSIFTWHSPASVSFAPFSCVYEYKGTRYFRFRAYFNLVWSYHNLVVSAKTLFTNYFHSQIQIRTWIHL